MKPRHEKANLLEGVKEMHRRALRNEYLIGPCDYFALGYMFGKYGIKDWSRDELVEGCIEYDKTDDLKLLDTIAETLMDMGYLKA